MYQSWLDGWDERRARRGEEWKRPADFVIDANRAFADAAPTADLGAFCDLATQALADPDYFPAPAWDERQFQRQDRWLTFPSDIPTDVEQNNRVRARITESGGLDHALVIFHHWNASRRNDRIARFFAKRGITVVEIAMPYHFERSRPGSHYADFMLSPNLGRTVQSVGQAVCDGRKLILWLKRQGYGRISVLGMSLGAWVAGLVAAHDASVSKASLFLGAGSLADMVWTGRATRAIRESLEPTIALSDLRRAWALLDLSQHAERLARTGLDLQLVLARRDTVVLPALSQQFLQDLKVAGARPERVALNCGHYSLALPPYIIPAGFRLWRFLRA